MAGPLLHVQDDVTRDGPDNCIASAGMQGNAQHRQHHEQGAATKRHRQLTPSHQPATHAYWQRRKHEQLASNAAKDKHGSQAGRTAPPAELAPTRKDAACGLCSWRALRREASEVLCRAACRKRAASTTPRRIRTDMKNTRRRTCLQLPVDAICNLVKTAHGSGKDLVA